ncbi:NB-ARC domain-containing protein [Embleya sp. NPDC020630]|uniref:NB-ARC domain-containing protein n=1 Tax=Embleya sp. NPDC020630 TaxID=3363979 RepID=UPI0037940C59
MIPAHIPWQLPPPRIPLVDRGPEREELDAHLALARRIGRPLRFVVTGVPGVGKTAFALDWLNRLSARFPDGQLYADLRDGDTWRPEGTRDVLAGWVGALGAPSVPEHTDQLTGLYRSLMRGRRMVVLLDDVGDEDQIRPLLSAGDSLTVITTRRRLPGLALDGCHTIELAPLDAEHGMELFAAVLGAQRVAAEPVQARRIVHGCGGLPLAVCLTAAEYAGRPRRPLRDRPHHVEGLDAINDTIAAIVDALPDDAKNLFVRLGVHPGTTFTPSALAALAGVRRADVDPPIRTLLDRQLLAPGPGAFGGETFVLPDVVRHPAAAAARALPPRERDDARRALYLGYYVPTASEAAQLLDPGRLFAVDAAPSATTAYLDDVPAAREWFDLEYDALTTIVLVDGEDGCLEAVHLLVDRLWSYWHQVRSGKHVVTAHRAGLRAARTCGDHRAIGRMLTSLALLLPAAASTEALDCLTEAESLFREAGNELFAARTLHYRGLVLAEADRPDEAAKAHRRVVPACVRLGEPRVAGLALDRLAASELARLATWEPGNDDHRTTAEMAAVDASAAHTILTTARDPLNAALAALTWAEAELACGRRDNSEKLTTAAIKTLRRDYPRQVPDACDRLARWADAMGDPTRATSYRVEAAALRREDAHDGTPGGTA